MNLLLHCGGHEIPEEELHDIATPEPTDTWQPLAHSDLNAMAHNALAHVGLNPINQVHAVMNSGDYYFSLIQVEDKSTDYATIVGLRNSHNKRFGAGLVAGNGVFVCDNLCFSGEINVSKRHLPDLHLVLPGLIEDALEQLIPTVERQRIRYQHYKRAVIGERRAARTIMDMYEQGALTCSQVGHVWDDFINPQHEEFARNGLTFWRLYNAATEQFKGSPVQVPKKSKILHSIFDNLGPDDIIDVEVEI